MEAEQIFQESGAVLKGHFLLTSGLHSPVYWEKFQVLQHPVYVEQLCRMIATHFQNERVGVVAGPTTGGVILAFEVARQLGVRGIFAEKVGEKERVFRRGFDIKPCERVLVVDDVLTTGDSVHQVLGAVARLGGVVVGVGVLVDRSALGVDFGVPLFSCLRSKAVTYKPEECPLCAQRVPLVRPGGS